MSDPDVTNRKKPLPHELWHRARGDQAEYERLLEEYGYLTRARGAHAAEPPSTRMPRAYKVPLGLPFYWMDEQSGELRAAVESYLDRVTEGGPPLTPERIAVLRDYLAHYINAPCWDVADAFAEELRVLRADVHRLTTAEGIDGWIAKCLDIGLDPL